jgi:hypothetical protein
VEILKAQGFVLEMSVEINGLVKKLEMSLIQDIFIQQ